MILEFLNPKVFMRRCDQGQRTDNIKLFKHMRVRYGRLHDLFRNKPIRFREDQSDGHHTVLDEIEKQLVILVQGAFETGHPVDMA